MVLCAFVLEITAILVSTHGHFTYTLDDAYIHLALAAQIHEGNYGIQPGTFSSPSSSVLWPILLAPTSSLEFRDWVPLVLNTAATFASSVVLVAIFQRITHRRGLAALLAVCGLALLNGVGVAFTGMEHSLQVLASLCVGYGVVLVWDSDRIPRWLPFFMVLGPFVRYENAAVSLAAAVVLLTRGHQRTAFTATAVWASGLAGFSAFLIQLGLSPLPSSVMAKSAYAAGEPLLVTGAHHAAAALTQPSFLVCLIVLAVDVLISRQWGLLHWYVVMVLAAQAVAGDFGWFGRYELYFLAAVLTPLVTLVSAWSTYRASLGRLYVGAVTGLVVLALTPLFVKTLQTPAAARDIRSQQAQTARFVSDYWQRPIAVNDLGLVALRGHQPVLDLWGLASQEAREARLQGDDPGWATHLMRSEGVDLAAIYAGWFTDAETAGWTHVGFLRGADHVSSASSRVDFYVLDPTSAAEACSALDSFAADTQAPTRVVTLC